VDCLVEKLSAKRVSAELSAAFVRRMIDERKTLGNLIDHIEADQMYG
jgi:hypothetical protein